jgi:hypothetical protein
MAANQSASLAVQITLAAMQNSKLDLTDENATHIADFYSIICKRLDNAWPWEQIGKDKSKLMYVSIRRGRVAITPSHVVFPDKTLSMKENNNPRSSS